MATAYVLECVGANATNGMVQLLFHVDVVDTQSGYEASQECGIFLNGNETADQIKTAIVAQALPQLRTYFPEFLWDASDLVLVSVVKGA